MCIEGDTHHSVRFREIIPTLIDRVVYPGTNNPHKDFYISTADLYDHNPDIWEGCSKQQVRDLFVKLCKEQYNQNVSVKKGKRVYIGFDFKSNEE